MPHTGWCPRLSPPGLKMSCGLSCVVEEGRGEGGGGEGVCNESHG